MYALKMLALIVLAGLCSVAFVVGYNYFQGVSASQRAREEASQLHQEIEHVIITGNSKNITVEVPGGYMLTFESNQLVIDGISFPKDENYEIPVSGPDLDPGSHDLLIKIEDGTVVISEVD